MRQDHSDQSFVLPAGSVQRLPHFDPPARRLRFASGNAFLTELRARIDTYFLETGRHRRDSVQAYLKAGVILAAFLASYVLLVFVVEVWWLAVPLAVLLGLATAGIGFNIQHDGGHEAFSRFRVVNQIMARSLDLIGGSSYVWHWKHGIIHHTYPNISGHDSDIELGSLARLTPHQPIRVFHRWQQWYLWPLYGVMAIKWHFYDDFRDVVVGGIGPHRIPRPRGLELALFVGGKIAFFTIAFGIPLIIHPWWVVATYYTLLTFVLGMVLSVVFQLAHCVEEATFPLTPAGAAPVDLPWAEHQVVTSVDFCRRSRVTSWLLGGLNFQIEHHLFPRISHANYPAISALVEQTCRDFGIRYNEHQTFWAGIASHFRWLRRMGAPATIG